MKSIYTIDIEGKEFIGNDKYAASLTDVATKTELEVAAFAEPIAETIVANIIVAEEAPEVTEPEVTEPEVTAPETTEPVTPPTTGDSAIIFVILAVVSVATLAIVSKKRSEE